MGETAVVLGAEMPLRDRLTVHTLPFLATLLNCTPKQAWERPLAFQVFDDVEDRKDPMMAKTLHGSLAALSRDLERRNRAGAGIFLAVNETDGKGRSKGHIISLRAWWADLDGEKAQSAFRPDVLPIPPSLLVKSGHGMHAYWCVFARLPCAGDVERQRAHEEDLKRIRAVLAGFGADRSVCEVARVMRLPGWWNRKREPHELVELVQVCPVRYTPEEIRAGFPIVDRPEAAQSMGRIRPLECGDIPQRARAYTEALARNAPAVAGARGHDKTLVAAIKVTCGFNLSEDEAFGLLWEIYNPACQPPWDEAELRRKIREALKVCTDRGWLITSRSMAGGAISRDSVPHEGKNPNFHPTPEEPPVEANDPTRPCFQPFRLDNQGLWYAPKSKTEVDGSESPTNPQKLCGPFRVIAETRNIRGHAWGLRLQWKDPDGSLHEETLPRELLLGEGTELARTLIRGGLRVAPDEIRRKKLVTYLASVRVPARARSVERVGWHAQAFVLPDESFGESIEGEKVFLALDMEHAFRVRGTLEEWRREVGSHARGNSRLAFALSVAFAAPLLGRLGMEGGGFHFYGQSSKGKTTCVEAAGSVWGGPVFRETWRATSNGLEAVAMSHCDCLLILDEQAQALPREAGEVAYLLANGLDKVRARKNLETRSRRRWLTLFLSTGEITLSDRMREEGRAPRAGQDVRMVDIPVNPDGMDQAFESWVGFETSKALADHLRLATRRCYGTSARAFLTRLCQMGDEALLSLERRKVAWARAHHPRGADSQVGRVVDRFALVALAGELATEWGIVPWRPGNAAWAAEVCLRAWLVQRGGIGAGEHERGIVAVLGFLERHGTSRFSCWENLDERVVNCAGFRRRDGQDRMDYLFHAEGWKDACEGFNPKDVARGCAEAGLLESVMESGKLRYQKNVKVPGRGTERFYIITGRGLEAFKARQAEVEG